MIGYISYNEMNVNEKKMKKRKKKDEERRRPRHSHFRDDAHRRCEIETHTLPRLARNVQLILFARLCLCVTSVIVRSF